MIAKIHGLAYQKVLDLISGGEEQSVWTASWPGTALHFGFCKGCDKTAVLLALPVRCLNAFSICDSENDFHKQPVRWTDPL